MFARGGGCESEDVSSGLQNAMCDACAIDEDAVKDAGNDGCGVRGERVNGAKSDALMLHSGSSVGQTRPTRPLPIGDTECVKGLVVVETWWWWIRSAPPTVARTNG